MEKKKKTNRRVSNPTGPKHIYIDADVHAELKAAAKLDGDKKINSFATEIIRAGLDYKKFLLKK